MKSLPMKILAAAAFALGAFGAASAAHAGRSDIHFSVGLHAAPGAYVQPAPVYVQPPAYVQPRHVYVDPRPGYVESRPLYVAPGYYDRHRYDDGWRHHRHGGRRWGPYGDLDRDGIMNYDDRDRDGDGVRNRRDRFPDNPYHY